MLVENNIYGSSYREQVMREIKEQDSKNIERYRECIGKFAVRGVFRSDESIALYDEFNIGNYIKQLTDTGISKMERRRLMKRLGKCDLVDTTTQDDSKVCINTTNGEYISFSRITDIMDDDRLGSKIDREGKCHSGSFGVSLKLSESFQIPNTVVTGYVHCLSSDIKVLHSWVEYTQDDEDFVMDYTMNAIMNKDGYYFLVKPEVLKSINSEDLASDIEILAKTNNTSTSLKEYLLFRDSIIAECKEKLPEAENVPNFIGD